MNTLLRRKESFWLLGFSTCFSLIVEEKVRQSLVERIQSADMTQKRRAELGELDIS